LKETLSHSGRKRRKRREWQRGVIGSPSLQLK